jgi:hypothetical protein
MENELQVHRQFAILDGWVVVELKIKEGKMVRSVKVNLLPKTFFGNSGPSDAEGVLGHYGRRPKFDGC